MSTGADAGHRLDDHLPDDDHLRTEEQRRLARDHRRLEAMLANSSDTVTLVDADGVVIDTTGARTPVMGYEQEFWDGRSVFDLAHPDDLPGLVESYHRVLASPGEQITMDVRARRSDEDWVHLELTAVNLLDDPSVAGIVLTSRNITERKQVEAELARRRDEALEQARLRTELVARVSHELRNQLHALRGLTELLATTEVPRSVSQLVATAHRQAEQFGHLVEDLLEFSSVDSGRVQPRPAPSWPRQLVADAVAMGRELAADGVVVSGSTSEQVPDVVLVDERRVRQVLANLVSNAAKFTRSGSIEVRAEHESLRGAPAIRWSVRDTGRGIPESERVRIFRAFDQGSAGSASGAGLGLAITDRLVTLLGGVLEVDSTVGAGSRFSVVLPASAPDGGGVDDDHDDDDGMRSGPPPLRPRGHVLVVEDNEVNQLLVAEQLDRLGVRATIVGTGTEALERLACDDIDLVLMDWQLPGLDGVETTRRHRRTEAHGRRVPILGMTASGRPSDRAECLAAGMDDLLVKPVSLADLAAALHPYLGERRTVSRTSDHPGADTDALDTLVDQLGSVAPVRSIVATFLGELDQREAAVLDGVAADDPAALRRAAHTLRSMSATLGALELDELSERLERGEFPPDQDTVEAFTRSVSETRSALEAWLERRPADPVQVPAGR